MADLLFEDALELPWEDVVAPGASIAVSAHGMNDELRNTRFTALQGEGRRVRPPARGAGRASRRGRRVPRRGHRRARAREARHHLARPFGCVALPPHLPGPRRRRRGAARVRARGRPAGAGRDGTAGRARAPPASMRPAATALWWWRLLRWRAIWRRASRASAGASSGGRNPVPPSGTSSSPRPTTASRRGWPRPAPPTRSTRRRPRVPTSTSCVSRACRRPRRPSRGRAGAPSARGCGRP